MIQIKKAILKRGREIPIKKGHLWIFSGAIEKIDPFENGSFLEVESLEGEFLGIAYFNHLSDIRGRIVSHRKKDPIEAIKESIRDAISFRKSLFSPGKTTACRLIHAEGDFLPGLIVDRYDNVLVLQISTLGMDIIKDDITKALLEELPEIEAVYEISESPSRKREGMQPKRKQIFGKEIPLINFLENRARFSIVPMEGQKTGFFLDQREMRKLIKKHAFGKKVLNAFSYTGGFSVFAALGGAIQVDSLDASEKALSLAKKHMEDNGFGKLKMKFIHDDAFSFLEKQKIADYGLVILDPPAFAKKRADVSRAIKGYRELNRLVLRNMEKGALLLTCSCSSLVSGEAFEKAIFEAAEKEKRTLQVLSAHIDAEDHPVLASHPETRYLKSLFLRVWE